MPLEIPPSLLHAIHEQLARAWPEEGCGILGGVEEEGARVVRRVIPASNRFDEKEGARRRRYLIEPEAYLAAERELAAAGLDVVGFYHSHPDCPAEPSATDRDWAWPWYSYLIVRVDRGTSADARSWRLREDRSGFEEEAVVVA